MKCLNLSGLTYNTYNFYMCYPQPTCVNFLYPEISNAKTRVAMKCAMAFWSTIILVLAKGWNQSI